MTFQLSMTSVCPSGIAYVYCIGRILLIQGHFGPSVACMVISLVQIYISSFLPNVNIYHNVTDCNLERLYGSKSGCLEHTKPVIGAWLCPNGVSH